MKEVAVIGSGIAGLATSIRLALKDYNVSVFEANSYLGGKLSSIKKEGFTFDTGPSLFTAPENIEALFSLAKKDVSSYFAYKGLDESCRYFFSNGKKIIAKKSLEAFADEAEKVFGEPAENTKKYLQNSKIAYQNIGELFIDFPLDLSLITKSETYKALFSVKLPYISKSLNSFNESSFKTPEMIQLFNRYATYNGSNPYKAPAMLSMISSLEQSQGTFYPDGGMISIIKALVQLAKDVGVKFYTNSKVEKIETLKGKVTGVLVNEKKYHADIVVSNMDIYYTYKNLLTDKNFANKVLKQERSSSAFIFY